MARSDSSEEHEESNILVGELQAEEQTGGRSKAYSIGNPDSAPELVKFIKCGSARDIKKLSTAKLLAAAQQGHATIAQWEAEIVDYIRQIDDLEKEVENQKTIIRYIEERRTPSTSTPSPAPQAAKSTKLPDPPVFDGKPELTIDDWLAKMRTKLLANGDHYNTEKL